MKSGKRSRQGISPVIASIILIAVTIGIAIAAAGWIFGLFGIYTGGPSVKVVSTVLTTSGSLTVRFANTGGLADGVDDVRIGTTSLWNASAAFTIPASTESVATFTGGGSLPAGQVITYTIRLGSGLTITGATSVQA